ncbi:MAG: DUF2202 domain-containing protein [Planctomycetota bacterium]|jgi:hypothetical protein
MRHNVITTIALTGLMSATTGVATAQGPQPGFGPGSGRCINPVPGPCLLPPQDPTPLGEEEQDALLGMRQEEKLARDVYLALHDMWNHQVFLIHRAEQRHMDAMAFAITRYDLDDPVADDTPGVFTDPAFTELYDELTADGAESLLEALMVAARIEEMDIVDLREALSVTTHPDLRWAYENLMRGSRNHLRAFAGRIDMLGGSYEAQYLTQEEFDEIAASPMERGPRQPAGRGAGRGTGAGRGWGRGQGMGRGQGGRGPCGGR